MPELPPPPQAHRRPTPIVAHGDTRTDDWYWLRDREDPAVVEYLEAENAYTRVALAPTEALQDEIFEEIRGRIQETDVSAPVHHGPWDYFTRTFEGSQYRVYGRRSRGAGEGVEEHVLLDENALAGDSDYFEIGAFAPSHGQGLLAYSTDFTGGERYTLRFRDLTSGADLPDEIPDAYYGLAWADDDRTVFYTRPDAAVRPYQVWRHTLGTPASDDVLVLQEDDERFFLGVERTRSGRYIVITAGSRVTSEAWTVPCADPTAPPTLVAERRQGVEYGVDHLVGDDGDRFVILTNDDAENFRVMTAPVATPGHEHWEELVPHSPAVKIDDVDVFAGHLVLSERAEGLERLRVLRLADRDEHVIAMPDPVYSVWSGENLEYDTTTLRYGYTSLVHPISSFDYDLDTRESTLVKQTPVRGGYDPSRFTSARLWATASDGVRVPISVVHRADVALDGPAPCLAYGYGSYETSIDPTFSVARLSLLERGFVFAIAHVRGGGELGRAWYEDGKLQRKRNTFTDFVAAAEHLCAQGYTNPSRLGARGGSAGGLLMGAVANLRPDLFRAIVAEVPFVDCVTTILDPSLPLTVIEWEEWGNPVEHADDYEYMKTYSPYDNVTAQDYPAMLVTAGLNDPRVSYWEPAKWVAKLRATKTDDRLLVLKTEMGAGHGGPSGRYDAWRDEAMVLAFLVTQLATTP